MHLRTECGTPLRSLVRVSYAPSKTKLLVSEARSQPGIRLHASGDGSHHQLHNGVCRNIANCGGERSPGLGEVPVSEEGVVNIIMFLRAVRTPRRPDFSHPVEVLPKVTVPRQELTQLEIYLLVATIYPGLKLSNETVGPATVRSFRPPPLPNLQSLHPAAKASSLPHSAASRKTQINRNHPSHDHHGRTGNGAVGAGDLSAALLCTDNSFRLCHLILMTPAQTSVPYRKYKLHPMFLELNSRRFNQVIGTHIKFFSRELRSCRSCCRVTSRAPCTRVQLQLSLSFNFESLISTSSASCIHVSDF
ncbi:hypothetical protein J6590_058818 [Homalodisca vitripennis]|nr:hypothetical protein J6590_058818 [Homalodisca vitripennis]